MTGKTKAAMPGRQCNTALQKHRQITRLAAGGQTLSQRNPYAQINRVRLTYGHRNPLNHFNYRETRELANQLNYLDYNESLESAGNKHEKYSGSPEHQHCLGSAIIFRGCIKENQQRTVLHRNPDLAYERVVPQSHEVNQAAKRYAENNPSLRGAVHSITESNPVQLSDSDLAFLRWRRLISPRIAVTINPALLSPSSLSDSISATTSCGTRTVKSCDFAFLLDVAITDSFDVWCVSVYAKKSYAQCLKCVSLECSFKSEGETHLTNSEARQCSNTNRASYHNVTEAYIMACIQHTQTRPKYQYRFLALSAIGRNVIHITATTEREAREQSPAGCVMVFAGRLPVEVRHA